tara:strand:- start:635 stop:1216 length:582 start_codon:yes stop_codon:yes gene_type:complete
MKLLLPSIVSALILPISVKAEVTEEIHKRCVEARDYSGCVRANQRSSYKVKRKMNGIGVTLFLNNNTAELTIQSVINNSPASDANLEIGDIILKINGKSTRGMGLKDAIKLIKGPINKPIELVIGRVNEKGDREKIKVKLIRDTFIIPEKESLNPSSIREFFNYDLPIDLQPMNPKRYYSPESKKKLFPNNQI